jgi:hypothetical protein
MHKINRDSVSVMLSLKVADVEPSSKRARLVERQVKLNIFCIGIISLSFSSQVMDCLESGSSAADASISSKSADGGRELFFPPISIHGQESVATNVIQPGQSMNVLRWMISSKHENRVHAPLESDLKSLVSVQFEVISSFWLNFPPAIDDITAVKRCFRLSKV